MSARERLLAAASELFYQEGVHTVGIDRVIERAGVAKATLYSNFGSKDELIRAYLTERYEKWKERMENRLVAYETPRERLLGVFDLQGETFNGPGFRGCAFMNASAEKQSGSAVEEVSDMYRASVRTLFTELAQDAGAVYPENLATQLVLLFDGATVAERMDRNPKITNTAREVATRLIDAAVSS
ncbi:TetR family transcriptional regulator [Paenibacillus sp. MAEPY2]|nr:TetR family transcriptional regulator [Paenibacillus sp. MAEPY2]KGP78090.1 TetR family transcriptional regulator [Paenibacillus sp. MAEPY1]OZQ58514.1 TetR family transcriptional regulator [Paenibacillus taichungensis]